MRRLLLFGLLALGPVGLVSLTGPGAASSPMAAAAAEPGEATLTLIGADAGLTFAGAAGWGQTFRGDPVTSTTSVSFVQPDGQECPALTVTFLGDDAPAAVSTPKAAKVVDGVCSAAAPVSWSAGDSPTGTLVVTADGLGTALTSYALHRSTRFRVYGVLGAVALVVSIGLAIALWKIADDLPAPKVPQTWAVDDALVTTITGVSAAGLALLAAGGVLEEFIPQYRLGGALAGGLVAAALLTLAPLLFEVVRRGDADHGPAAYAAASAATLTAAVLQIALVALVVVNADLLDGARFLVWIVAGGLVGLLGRYTVVYTRRLDAGATISASL